jgi:hypothetical protein
MTAKTAFTHPCSPREASVALALAAVATLLSLALVSSPKLHRFASLDVVSQAPIEIELTSEPVRRPLPRQRLGSAMRTRPASNGRAAADRVRLGNAPEQSIVNGQPFAPVTPSVAASSTELPSSAPRISEDSIRTAVEEVGRREALSAEAKRQLRTGTHSASEQLHDSIESALKRDCLAPNPNEGHPIIGALILAWTVSSGQCAGT